MLDWVGFEVLLIYFILNIQILYANLNLSRSG